MNSGSNETKGTVVTETRVFSQWSTSTQNVYKTMYIIDNSSAYFVCSCHHPPAVLGHSKQKLIFILNLRIAIHFSPSLGLLKLFVGRSTINITFSFDTSFIIIHLGVHDNLVHDISTPFGVIIIS